MTDAGGRIAVFLHSGDWDLMHQGLSIALAGAAARRPVDLFFFWWALDRLVKDRLDQPDLGTDRGALAEELSERRIPTLRELLEAARKTSLVRLHACTGSLAILGHAPPAVQERVDELVGWSTILDRTTGVTDRFWL